MSNEEIKAAVLAECKRLAPTFGVKGIIFGALYVTRWFDGTGWSIHRNNTVELCHLHPDIDFYSVVWKMAYRLLGLDNPRWIPVGGSMPECGRAVLVSDGLDVCEAILDEKGKWQGWMLQKAGFIDRHQITHWMPLPKFEEAK